MWEIPGLRGGSRRCWPSGLNKSLSFFAISAVTGIKLLVNLMMRMKKTGRIDDEVILYSFLSSFSIFAEHKSSFQSFDLNLYFNKHIANPCTLPGMTSHESMSSRRHKTSRGLVTVGNIRVHGSCRSWEGVIRVMAAVGWIVKTIS